MNVACTACPAKYAVPDERVRGKRARITCKHCGTSIIVDGTHLGAAEGGSVVAARPARKTMVGMGAAGTSASAPPSASMPTHSAPTYSAPTHSAPTHSAPVNSAPSNAVPSGGTAWLVALADGRREPASLARVVDLYAAGTIDAATYVWREGMPDWKTPFAVPEIAAALTARGLASQRPPANPFAPAEPDPEEATRVGMSAYEDPRARRPTLPPLRSGSGLHRPPAEDDDGITIARSGPPSSPVSLPPLRPRSEPPPAAGRPAAQAVRRNTPPATRPPSNPPPPAVPAAAAAPGRRPRAHTLPGDLVISLTGPGAPPPTPAFAPRNQPFAAAAAAAARRTPSSPPPPGASPPSPSNVQASSAPPPPPPPSPLPAPSALASAQQILGQSPAFALPQVTLTPSSVNVPAPAPGAMNAPAAVRSAADFEVPPRSAAPVSLPLDFAPQRRRRNVATAAGVGLLALAGVGAALFFKASARPPKAAVAPVASTAAAVATPPPAVVAPAPSSEPETTPAPSAEPEKPAAKERPSPAPRAAAKRDDAPRAASAKKVDLAKAVSGDTTSAAEEAPSEGATEAPTHAEEPAKKADTAGAGTTPFDREAASNALSDAALRAGSCRMLGGPTGSAQATVTFAPNGHVSAASVGGDFAGSVVGACIVKLFRGATVPPFAGEPITVAKRFTVE